ncbi:hypothetical protein [Vibrio intestinalis]|uniref:hypothetical protein n=1 Tax=Vibrio intestinalis TaxID=2933291 RepID=UPI0021A6C7B5|nr:hypothetical protein [Vibrio intestinalis]
MKKTLLALAVTSAASIASTGAFADTGLNSLTHEVKVNDHRDGYTKTEWTLGKGSYTLSENVDFLFDVDKDFISNPGAENQEGWDTQFGLAQSAGSFGSFDLTLYYLYRYDSVYKANNGEIDARYDQYIIAPFFSTDVTLFDNDFSFGIELWAQGGNTHSDSSLQAMSGVETNFYLSGDLSEHWNLSLAWYNFGYYTDETIDEYHYQVGTEDYLTYTLPLTEKLTFKIENYIEAYHTPETDVTKVYSHIKPSVTFSQTISEGVSFHASVAYEVVSWDYKDAGDGSDGQSTSNNNEFEFVVGFKF